MNPPSHPKGPWDRLAAGARHGRQEHDTSAPYGFATRIAALAEVAPRQSASLFERFALRAVGLAALLALGSVAFSLSQSSGMTLATGAASAHEQTADAQSDATDDALSVLVDA